MFRENRCLCWSLGLGADSRNRLIWVRCSLFGKVLLLRVKSIVLVGSPPEHGVAFGALQIVIPQFPGLGQGPLDPSHSFPPSSSVVDASSFEFCFPDTRIRDGGRVSISLWGQEASVRAADLHPGPCPVSCRPPARSPAPAGTLPSVTRDCRWARPQGPRGPRHWKLGLSTALPSLCSQGPGEPRALLLCWAPLSSSLHPSSSRQPSIL